MTRKTEVLQPFALHYSRLNDARNAAAHVDLASRLVGTVVYPRVATHGQKRFTEILEEVEGYTAYIAYHPKKQIIIIDLLIEQTPVVTITLPY